MCWRGVGGELSWDQQAGVRHAADGMTDEIPKKKKKTGGQDPSATLAHFQLVRIEP